MKRASSFVAFVTMALVACGGGGGADKPVADPTAGAGAAADAGGASTTADAGPQRPFAENAQQATSMIDDVIALHVAELGQCVQDARIRRKDPHAKISVDLGIDQEGTLIGAKPSKGQPADKELEGCFIKALSGAPFPKSRAGVITVTKTFSDQVVYR
jgi:hypothetical protein